MLTLIVLITATLVGGLPTSASATTPAAGLRINLRCEPGATGPATFRVTANGATALVTVPCGGSTTVTNPAWTAGTMASIEPASAPRGTYVLSWQPMRLSTEVVDFYSSLAVCSGRNATAACPARSGLGEWLLLAMTLGVVLSILLIIPFEFWMIRGWIRYFSRKQDPRAVIEDLSARPGLGWWVRRYVGWVRMKHRLFGRPLPPGFEA